MKLKFLKPYPNSSIKKAFDDIELNDFSIITGKNGVGKTQFLEAIVDKDNYIDIDNGSNAIYFNYNDFVVEHVKNNQQRKQSKLKKKNTNLNDIKSSIRDTLYQPLYNKFHKHSTLLSQVWNHLMKKNDFLNVEDWSDFRSELLTYSLDEELLKSMYTQFKNNVEVFLEREDERIEKYLNKAQSLNIHFNQLNQNHFQYQENWLGQLLNNEFKDYVKRYSNAKKEIECNNSDEITKGEIKRRTIEKVGIEPWNLLNEILKKYSCNDYYIDEELADKIEYFINIDQQPLEIKLKSHRIEESITLDRLSSGERTLFALAVSLYRQERDSSLPTILLLDEIDSSLHPSMCKQLLDVLENVFVKEHKLKIIMVTHSPSTVALAPKNSVYIMKNNDGKISLENNGKQRAIQILSEGFLTFKEGIGLLQKQKPQVYLEGTTDIDYWNKAFEFFDDLSELKNSIELIDGNGGESKKTYKNLASVPSNYILSKHVFVFDCDEQKQEKIEDKLCFIKNQQNEDSLAEDGIENLFSKTFLEKAYNYKNDFFKKIIEESRGQRITVYKVHSDEKRNLCDWICQNASKDEFRNFKPILEKVQGLLREK